MKMSEFAKLTGIKRTALQLYDKKGLLQPIPESRNGYWEYDEDTLLDAMLILILKRADYPLSEIKRILNTVSDFTVLLDSAEENIRQKIRELEGTINYIKLLRISSGNQYLLQPIISKINFIDFLRKSGGLKKEIDQYIAEAKHNRTVDRNDSSDEEYDEDPELDRELAKIGYALFYICLLLGIEPPEGPAAQETLHRIHGAMNTLAYKYNEESFTESEFIELINDLLQDLTEEDIENVEKNYGSGSVKYLFQVIEAFKSNCH